MLKSLRQYLPVVIWDAFAVLVIGAAGAGIGWLTDFGLIDPKSPWFWTVAISIALLIGPFHTFHRVRIERDNYHPILARPDVCMKTVLDTLFRSEAIQDGGNELKVFRELRQAAAEGNIWIWGRDYSGLDVDTEKPLVKIEAEYWRDHSFEETVAMSAREEVVRSNMTRDDMQSRPQELYCDLHLNSVQVRKRWPRSGRHPLKRRPTTKRANSSRRPA